MTDIIKAIQAKDFKTVESMIKDIPNINCLYAGSSLLGFSIRYNADKITQLLLHHGANPNFASNTSKSSLYLSTFKKNTTLAKLLIQYGGDVDLPGAFNMTPLHLCVAQSNFPLGNYYIKIGCNLDTHNLFGQSPIFEAISKDNSLFVDELLRNGSRVSIFDQNGTNAIHHLPFERRSQYLFLVNQQTKVFEMLMNRFQELLDELTNYTLPNYQNLIHRKDFLQSIHTLKKILEKTPPSKVLLRKLVKRFNHMIHHPINQLPRNNSLKQILYRCIDGRSIPRSNLHLPQPVLGMILNHLNHPIGVAQKNLHPIFQVCERINQQFCALKNTHFIHYNYDLGKPSITFGRNTSSLYLTPSP